MAQTYFAYKNSKIFGFGKLLQEFCAGFFQNSISIDEVDTEKCQILVDRRM